MNEDLKNNVNSCTFCENLLSIAEGTDFCSYQNKPIQIDYKKTEYYPEYCEDCRGYKNILYY